MLTQICQIARHLLSPADKVSLRNERHHWLPLPYRVAHRFRSLQFHPRTPKEYREIGRRVALEDDGHELAHAIFIFGLKLARSQGNVFEEAYLLLSLATNLLWYCPEEVDQSSLTGDELCEEALAIFENVGDEAGRAACLRELSRFEESIEICRRINDQQGLALSLHRWGVQLACQKEHAQSQAAYDEALSLAEHLNDKRLLAVILESRGICLRGEEDNVRAR